MIRTSVPFEYTLDGHYDSVGDDVYRRRASASAHIKKRRFWSCLLTVRPFFLEFRKFQLIESLELMRFSHFWGKLAANLPPRLQTADEARLSVQLVNSLETKLPNLRISFQNKRTVR